MSRGWAALITLLTSVLLVLTFRREGKIEAATEAEVLNRLNDKANEQRARAEEIENRTVTLSGVSQSDHDRMRRYQRDTE